MNFTSRSLAATLLVIVTLGLGYFVVKPKYSDYTDAKTRVAQAQTKEDNLKDAQKRLNNFLSEYKAHAATAALLNQSLPLSQPEMANILNNLDNLTKSTNLTLGQLSIVETPESDQLGAASNSIQTVDMSVNGAGTFEAFKAFLGKLESNLRIIDIGTLSIQSESSGIKFTMSFKTYYQK